jgi:hypothetical protein
MESVSVLNDKSISIFRIENSNPAYAKVISDIESPRECFNNSRQKQQATVKKADHSSHSKEEAADSSEKTEAYLETIHRSIIHLLFSL